MRAADDIRHRVNAYLAQELGELSPVDETRIALLELAAEQVHHHRDAPPSVETDTGVKGNPDHAALQKWAALARGLLKDLEAPVLAKRAAKAAAQQPAGLTPAQRAREQMRALEEMPPS